jgi:hypothetical protein
MKYSIQLILVLSLLFLTSFVNSDDRNLMDNNVFTEVIKVSLNQEGTGLILDDGNSKGANITTKVSKNSKIIWKLEPNSGITSLDSLVSKNGVNVFITKPKKNGTGDLLGEVGDVAVGTIEEYGIYYTIDGASYMHDPKIQIH